MNLPRIALFAAASLLAASTWAQSKPLNLKLPPASALPASSGTVAAKPTTPPPAPVTADKSAAPVADTQAAYGRDPPGTFYGDTSNHLGGPEADARPRCDDATYNQPQMHGSVGMGVVGGNHVSGSYQGGAVNLSQAFGSCEHPTGGMSISVGGTTGHFHGR